MENLREWVEKHCHLWEELEVDRNRYFKPKRFTINIRKDVLAHQIGDEVEKIATYVKPSMKTTPYDFLNELIISSLKKREKGEALHSVVEEHLKKFSCFLYFVTVTKKFNKSDIQLIEAFKKGDKNEKLENISREKEDPNDNKSVLVEKIVYVGISTDLIGRYKDGHKVTQKLNDPKWNKNLHKKKIYIATVEVNADVGSEQGVDLPLEVLKPYKLVDSILHFLESFFIAYFGVPEYNNKDTFPKIDFPNWPWIPFVEDMNIPKYDNSILFGEDIEIDVNKKIEILEPSLKGQKLKRQKTTSS
ncbi:hypothetical protein BpJC4_31570 [Weizmannia acidilactici]|uniref:hypothetical protein n=1 Tax=Weizmannia acidilactici TaxID=2607726 RepID=UPI00124E132A|nr:hypothetical protein [Weizmannia acidilactici]GER68686.1 hypothetical protein BpJC4_31570 [Weizmannia acidilactici]